MQEEEKYFGLGPGRLYIAPLSVPEAEARSLRYYVGPTKGGVHLAYSAKIHEITDYTGRLIRQLRYGERIRLSGRMARLYPAALRAVTGSPGQGGLTALGGQGEAGRLQRVRVILQCALPAGSTGGGEMGFSCVASAVSGAAFSLSGDRDCACDFSLTAESDDAGMCGRLVFS